MSQSYLETLNPRQREAVEFGDGLPSSPLLIIAGAGSGKTLTLATRVAHSVIRGADPDRILLLTFSRRAAASMAERVASIVAKALSAQTTALPWSGTFHAIGARLLRDYAANIGLSPNFSIHDRSDSADLLDLVRHELGFSKTEGRFPQKATCLSIYSRTVNTRRDLSEVLAAWFPWCGKWEAELRTLFADYVAAKQAQSVLDFDDLLLYWAGMMQVPDIACHLADRFDYILVDEYQDTNAIQAEILLALKPNGQGVTVVGDDCQSIYRFRAAEIENILSFPTQFTPAARVITLDQNYRSTKSILTAANAVIGLAERRYTKDLWSDRPAGERPQLVTVQDDSMQAKFIAERLLRNREDGDRLKDQAILFRSSHHSAVLEIELSRRNIPYVKFGGLKFLEATHVKDIMCLLRWAENIRDKISGFRILKLLPGLGAVRAGRLMDRMLDAIDPFSVLRSFDPPAPTRLSWPAFADMLGNLRSSMSGWPAEFTLVKTWYAPILEDEFEDAGTRLADIDQLEQIAATYPSRQKFLSDLTLDPADASTDQSVGTFLDEDYVILSTVHSAKGLEFSRVFVLNCVDGAFPSDLAVGEQADIEEERRLLYVAMTRAKNSLDLMQPRNFYVHGQQAYGDRHVLAARTRFIPNAILDHFERIAWPSARATASSALPSDRNVDLLAAMRGMWSPVKP